MEERLQSLDMNENETFSCDPNITGTYLLFTADARMNYLALGLVYGNIGVISLFLNITFLIFFFKKKNILKVRSNALLFLLVCCDLITCVLVIPPYTVLMIFRSKGYQLCAHATILKALGYSTVLMSLVPVFGYNIDQYVAILKPFQYNPRKGVKKIISTIFSVWILIFSLAGVSMYVGLWNYYCIFTGSIAILTCIITLGLNICINKELFRMVRKEKKSSNARRTELIKSHRKTLNIATTVFIIYVLVYLPTFFMTIYRVIEIPSLFITSFIFSWIQPISLTNVLWNPVLYYYKMKSVRSMLIKTMFCCRKEKKPIIPMINGFQQVNTCRPSQPIPKAYVLNRSSEK